MFKDFCMYLFWVICVETELVKNPGQSLTIVVYISPKNENNRHGRNQKFLTRKCRLLFY